MMNELINCGRRPVQVLGRVAINDVLKQNAIQRGDIIEVYIKKVES